MTLLWTDYCLLGLLMIIVLYLISHWHKSHTQDVFKRLWQKPSAIVSGIILLFFLLIAVLDSIHIKTANTMPSVLDKLLAPVGQTYEKTYSSPLAFTLFNKKMHLTFVPQTITHHAMKWHYIRIAIMLAFSESIGVSLCLWMMTSLLYQRWVPTKNRVLALASICICLFLFALAYHLSRDFHVFGTGKIGQDIFYYAIKSIRTGLVIGTLTTLFMMPLAIVTGLSAGYFGGLVDDVIQYIYTTLSSIPSVLLITASVLSMQTWMANHPQQFTTLDDSADARLLALCVILGTTSWTSLCRLLRAEAIRLREMDFILAAKALGSSWLRIFYKHLLPNVMPIIIITLALDFSFLVMAEAVLSYVGVGVSPMTISWGNMINGARLELAREPLVWWPMTSAFIVMFILVLASNLFADALRDALDSRQAD